MINISFYNVPFFSKKNNRFLFLYACYFEKNRISGIRLQPDIRIRLFLQPDNPDPASKSLSATPLLFTTGKRGENISVSRLRKYVPLKNGIGLIQVAGIFF